LQALRLAKESVSSALEPPAVEPPQAGGAQTKDPAASAQDLVAQTTHQAAQALAIKAVGCLRLCSRGPLLAWDGPGGPALFSLGSSDPCCAPGAAIGPEQARALVLAAATASGPDALAALDLEAWRLQAPPAMGPPDPEAPGLIWERLDLGHPFFALQKPVVLEHCGWIDPDSIDDALAHGVYGQWHRCIPKKNPQLNPEPSPPLSPEAVRATIRRSGLRGRGGAGYPTGLKWDTVALQPPGPRFVVCNADEGDPGAFMDRSVLEGDPHRLLEGLAIAAFAVGAERGYIYVRAEYPLAISRLRRALEQANARGILGLGSGLELELRIGAGAYVCGEETALLQSIEGGRGQPRPRPPFPAQAGLWGAPTLINNVETLAAVPPILCKGAEWFAAMGTATSKGTKVFSLSGVIRHTGLVEVPMGTSLRTVVETMGGGVPGGPGSPGGGVKAVQTGGPSGGCIPAHLLDTPVDYESLQALGSAMGSGGMVVVGQAMAMPALARHFMHFSVEESCGKCLPCRAGTVQLEQLLDRLLAGLAGPGELEQLEQLCRMVKATSLCGLGQCAPNPVLSALRHFRAEFLDACQSEPPQPQPAMAPSLAGPAAGPHPGGGPPWA
jgi:bidirectional [NiFe] hydrogenase diaphorase subunit